MTYKPWLIFTAAAALAGCTNPAPPATVAAAPPPSPPVLQTPPGETGAGGMPSATRPYDGLYSGSLVLTTASAQSQCPRGAGDDVTMRVQDGHATIDLTHGASFGGDVRRGGQLTLAIQDGPTATIVGHFTGNGYVSSSSHGQCIYRANLSKQPT